MKILIKNIKNQKDCNFDNNDIKFEPFYNKIIKREYEYIFIIN